MENNKWTDKDEIHRIMNDATDMNNVFFELTSRIKRYDNRVGNLPPIAIYYNNKMVEIYHYFQDRKVPYAHSSLNRTISTYFTMLIKEALKALNKYIECANNLFSTSDIELTEELQRMYIEDYKDLSDKILNFSIEKDISVAINVALDRMEKEEWFNVNDDITEYNKELEQLNIPIKIEYRDNKKNNAEKIDEKELDEALKLLEEYKEKNPELNNMIDKYAKDHKITPESIIRQK